MSANDQRLFDVGRFRRAGYEGTELGPVEIQPLVRLVHIVDDLIGRNHERQVLHDEIEGPQLEPSIGHPNGGIFRDGEIAGQNCKIDRFKLVRIDDFRKIDIRLADSRHERDSLLGIAVSRNLAQPRVRFRGARNMQEFAADGSQHGGKLSEPIGVLNPLFLERRQFVRRGLMSTNGREDFRSAFVGRRNVGIGHSARRTAGESSSSASAAARAASPTG